MTDRPTVSAEDMARLGGAIPVKGLRCRVCGCSDFRVLYTSQGVAAIARRRVCRHCGFRVTTAEAIKEKPPKPAPGRKRGRPRKVATPPPPPADGAPF